MKDLFWLRISVEKCVLSEQLKMLTLNRFTQFVLYDCNGHDGGCRVAKKLFQSHNYKFATRKISTYRNLIYFYN